MDTSDKQGASRGDSRTLREALTVKPESALATGEWPWNAKVRNVASMQ